MSYRTFSVALVAVSALTLGACRDQPSAGLMIPGSGMLASDVTQCTPAPPDSIIDLPIADPSKRIDLYTPVFSHPTSVTNPLFPISNLHQAILIGAVDGEPLRIETTLLPKTIPMDMGDHVVETLGSSFLAILGRRVTEFALDRYAQADDGSVWYFGEDVFDYEDGEVISTEGTWFACVDGPAAMIMGANPQVGQVWRTENVFPVVFEEITVTHTGLTLPGARGPIPGGIRVLELHMDGELEPKTFAPGYGEHSSGVPPENFEATALAVPADALPGPTPTELTTLLTGSRSVFRASRSGDWTGAQATVAQMNGAWQSYQALNPPPLLQPFMTQALADLTQAVSGQQADQSRQAALDVMRNTIDFALQYRSRVELDFLRLELWSRQMEIDAQAHDRPGVKSDLVILGWIHQRLRGAGSGDDQRLTKRVGQQLEGIDLLARRYDLDGVLAGARQLQQVVTPPSSPSPF